jgi:hypothetical protein
LRWSYDDSIPLIQILNPKLCNFAVDASDRFSAWRDLSGQSFQYLFDLLGNGSSSDGESNPLGILESKLFDRISIAEIVQLIVRMYTLESRLYGNINTFLRCFPIRLISKFMKELNGVLRYIYLLQSSIEYLSRLRPLQEDIQVYRGFRSRGSYFASLFESMIGDVIVWAGFTSTSTDRDRVIADFIEEDGILFKINLHVGDVGVSICNYSQFKSENEILIAASSGFRVESVDFKDVEGRELNSSSFPKVTLSYFLHWSDFDLEQRPSPVLVESDDSEAFALEMP